MLELAHEHGAHFSWTYRLLARYWEEGEAGLEPRSRRPTRSLTATSAAEDEIVHICKQFIKERRLAGSG